MGDVSKDVRQELHTVDPYAEVLRSRLNDELVAGHIPGADKLEYGKIKELMQESTRDLGTNELHQLAIRNLTTPTEARTAAAKMYAEAAYQSISNHTYGTQAADRLTASALCDKSTAEFVKDQKVRELMDGSRSYLGDAAGLATSLTTKWGVNILLSSLAKSGSLPVKDLAFAAALATGGLVNNEVAGRDLIDKTGYLRNGAWFAGSQIYGGLSSGVFESKGALNFLAQNPAYLRDASTILSAGIAELKSKEYAHDSEKLEQAWGKATADSKSLNGFVAQEKDLLTASPSTKEQRSDSVALPDLSLRNYNNRFNHILKGD